ncbi:hypothetical protein [Candidatus Phytoplasma oryzae]|nr:hypothetical protein PIE28_00320 [Candidatus Phytoplasma oryzae]
MFSSKYIFFAGIIVGSVIGGIFYKLAQDNQKILNYKKLSLNINQISQTNQTLNDNEENINKFDNLKNNILNKWFSSINNITENIYSFWYSIKEKKT